MNFNDQFTLIFNKMGLTVARELYDEFIEEIISDTTMMLIHFIDGTTFHWYF